MQCESQIRNPCPRVWMSRGEDMALREELMLVGRDAASVQTKLSMSFHLTKNNHRTKIVYHVKSKY